MKLRPPRHPRRVDARMDRPRRAVPGPARMIQMQVRPAMLLRRGQAGIIEDKPSAERTGRHTTGVGHKPRRRSIALRLPERSATGLPGLRLAACGLRARSQFSSI